MLRQRETIWGRRSDYPDTICAKNHKLPGKIRYGFKRYRFSFYCEEWIRQERGRVKDSTYVKYDNVLKKHILPRMGECFPPEINSQLVELFKQELQEALSVRSVKDVLVVLHSILGYTARKYPGVFQPVEFIYPREPKEEIRVLSVEEQKRLVAYLQTDMDACKLGIYLALLTGMRIGELCALRWEKISLRDQTIRVDTTMQRLRNLDQSSERRTKVVIGSPKSESSLRTIPLTDSMARLCERFDPHRPPAFLLTGTENYMEPRQVQRRLAKYTEECGLDGVHFHTIRHTFATRCVEAGFEIKSLSEILGHASTSVTLGCYVHSSMDLKRANLDKLETIYY